MWLQHLHRGLAFAGEQAIEHIVHIRGVALPTNDMVTQWSLPTTLSCLHDFPRLQFCGFTIPGKLKERPRNTPCPRDMKPALLIDGMLRPMGNIQDGRNHTRKLLPFNSRPTSDGMPNETTERLLKGVGIAKDCGVQTIMPWNFDAFPIPLSFPEGQGTYQAKLPAVRSIYFQISDSL